jgi:hypothetical protein
VTVYALGQNVAHFFNVSLAAASSSSVGALSLVTSSICPGESHPMILQMRSAARSLSGSLDLVRRRVLANSVFVGLAKRVVPVDRAGCCSDGLGEELKQLLLGDDPLTLHNVLVPSCPEIS